MMRAVLLVTLVSCAAAPQPTPRSNHGCANYDDRPAGSAADYVPPTLPGFIVSAPRTCKNDHGTYIRIERTKGARKLGTARGPSGGFSEGCTKPPAEGEECPVLNWGVPMTAAREALEAQHIMVNGIGGGPCADTGGDYAAWNISIGVVSWTQAAAALQAVADAMDRYDVEGYMGVAVKGIPCATLL
jgi:hypothetical protein